MVKKKVQKKKRKPTKKKSKTELKATRRQRRREGEAPAALPTGGGDASPHDDWTLEDFVSDISKTMKKQERENPRLVRLHERLSPEFKEITDLIYQFIEAQDEAKEEERMDAILSHGKKALLPFIEFIRLLKKGKEPENI